MRNEVIVFSKKLAIRYINMGYEVINVFPDGKNNRHLIYVFRYSDELDTLVKADVLEIRDKKPINITVSVQQMKNIVGILEGYSASKEIKEELLDVLYPFFNMYKNN